MGLSVNTYFQPLSYKAERIQRKSRFLALDLSRWILLFFSYMLRNLF